MLGQRAHPAGNPTAHAAVGSHRAETEGLPSQTRKIRLGRDSCGGAYLRTIASTPRSARITLIDAPVVLGWTVWRTCDDGPFRSMVRASLSTYEGLGAHYDLDKLTELLLGAITEAAEQVAT